MTTFIGTLKDYLRGLIERRKIEVYPDEKFSDLAIHRIIALLNDNTGDASKFEFTLRPKGGNVYHLKGTVIVNDTLSFVVYNDEIVLSDMDQLVFSMPYPYDISVV
jgi:hypothetical protein